MSKVKLLTTIELQLEFGETKTSITTDPFSISWTDGVYMALRTLLLLNVPEPLDLSSILSES